MDMNKGVVCSITNDVATFQDSCESFIVDEEAKEKKEAKAHQQMQESQPAKEILNSLSPDMLERLRSSQDYLYGILGGLAATLLSATLWAAITVATEYQIGYMAIAVGLIVGFSVRYFGAGIDTPFGFIGAFMAILGCLAGNVFSQIWFFADYQHMSFFDAFKLVNGAALIDVISETFSPMDLFFYAIALYEGYKFSFRSVTHEEIRLMSKSEEYIPEPANQKYRMPIVVVIFIGLSILFFSLKSGTSGVQQFYYEDGITLMSEGELVDGTVHGHWKYYDQNGNLYMEGDFDNGIEDGKWDWYDGYGHQLKTGSYIKGNPNGVWISYSNTGNVTDSGSYKNGRMTGIWVQKHPNGQLAAKGEMYLDNPNGRWEYYDANGQKSNELNYIKGVVTGHAKIWYSNGLPSQELEYLENGNLLIKSAWSSNGEQFVTDGNGIFKSYYDNNKIYNEGKVENGLRVGLWKSYYYDGSLKSTGRFDQGGEYVFEDYFDEFGEQQIKNGIGKAKLYNDTGNYEEGELKDGYRHGDWKLYNSSGSNLLAEMSYVDGKLNGIFKNYFPNTDVLSYEGYYENGKRTGISTWYYDNGTVESTVNFTDDKKDGVQEFFNDLGIKIREENYKRGELVL